MTPQSITLDARPLPPTRRTFRRTCIECGEEFRSESRTAEFCKGDHRRTFNNRRLQRGAQLYDLFMACRYDRKTAQDEGAMTLLYRMAQDFREEDRRERQGRHSWLHPKRILERHPHLLAVATDGRTRRR